MKLFLVFGLFCLEFAYLLLDLITMKFFIDSEAIEEAGLTADAAEDGQRVKQPRRSLHRRSSLQTAISLEIRFGISRHDFSDIVPLPVRQRGRGGARWPCRVSFGRVEYRQPIRWDGC